jgi:hypothetical protein
MRFLLFLVCFWGGPRTGVARGVVKHVIRLFYRWIINDNRFFSWRPTKIRLLLTKIFVRKLFSSQTWLPRQTFQILLILLNQLRLQVFKQVVKTRLMYINTVGSQLKENSYKTVKIESFITALSVHTVHH